MDNLPWIFISALLVNNFVLALFLGIGTAIGAIFSTVVFTASAFSLPMIMHRKVDAITAVLTSVNAVLRNKTAMLMRFISETSWFRSDLLAHGFDHYHD